jgi:uncharacterized protein YktA (UPF0223 family)
MVWSPNRSFNNNTPRPLTEMQERYKAETGGTIKDEKAYDEWVKATTGMDAGKNRFNEMMANRSQNPVLGQTQAGMSGFDKFQAMQAARDNTEYTIKNPFNGLLSGIDMNTPAMQDKMRANAARQRSEQGARFNAAMGANPLILQQLQMGQRQMGPQFNAFGFGAQPGLAAQGGQGGSMLANISSQGMNQLAAGQQNNPTIFKAKS